MGKRNLTEAQIHRKSSWHALTRPIQPKSLLIDIPNHLSGRFAELAPISRSGRSVIKPRPISKRHSEILGTPVQCHDKLVVVGEWKCQEASSVSTVCSMLVRSWWY